VRLPAYRHNGVVVRDRTVLLICRKKDKFRVIQRAVNSVGEDMADQVGEDMADRPVKEPIVSRDIQRFAIKVCIVAIVSVIAVDWIVQSAIEGVEESTARTLDTVKHSLAGGAPFWAKVEKALDDAAAQKLPPEKKQKLLHDIDEIITQYRPFVDEAQSKLKTSPNSPN
jgi:hypothetical protein